MKVAGRDLVAPFDVFWERFKLEIPLPAEYIEEGHSSVFGAQGMDLTAPETPAWTSLPDDDLAYHVAHELTHIVLRQRGFPKTGRGKQYPEDSAEARIGADLEEMVLHPALEELIQPFGFKRDFMLKRMVDGAIRGVSHSPIPENGTPWFFTWAIRYCGLQLELPSAEWALLDAAYRSRSLAVRQLGEELVSIMRDAGWSTPLQALDAMVSARNSLGLKVDRRILVIDAISGDIL